MKKELDRAMKHLLKGVPNTHVSIDIEYQKHTCDTTPYAKYKVYIAGTDKTAGFFTKDYDDPMTAVLDALVKFSQQLEEAANAGQTN